MAIAPRHALPDQRASRGAHAGGAGSSIARPLFEAAYTKLSAEQRHLYHRGVPRLMGVNSVGALLRSP